MFEHQEWRGAAYDEGIKGQKLAIVGFSHWGDAETSEFTKDVMEHVVTGDGHSFFTKIRSYFG